MCTQTLSFFDIWQWNRVIWKLYKKSRHLLPSINFVWLHFNKQLIMPFMPICQGGIISFHFRTFDVKCYTSLGEPDNGTLQKSLKFWNLWKFCPNSCWSHWAWVWFITPWCWQASDHPLSSQHIWEQDTTHIIAHFGQYGQKQPEIYI